MLKKILFIIIAAAAAAVFVIMIYLGAAETKVSVTNEKVKIEGIYGVEFELSEITDVTMIEYSMDEIGKGEGKNTYTGRNGSIKGRFIIEDLGEVLLFVQPNISPTLWIERGGKEDIFISYEDGRKTEWVYREIKAAIDLRA